ncbi:MAG: DUF1501 domain-containing protein [Planctomycetaceae bacterium]
MMTLLGHGGRMCDGISRRSFLKIGGLAMGAAGGIGLPSLLRASAAAGQVGSSKAVIHIFLAGGPPHQDMWDIKVDAPREIRGEFLPIDTNVPGIQIGECFPQIASMFDKFAAIRSIVDCEGAHDGFQCLTGWKRRDMQSMGGRPSAGSAVAKLAGPTDPGIPPHVALAEKTQHVEWSEPGSPGFLGAAYKAFRPNGDGMDDLTLKGISLERLKDRKALLSSLDNLKRETDATGMMEGMDAFTEAAFGVLTSSRLADALDVSKEPDAVRARYGTGRPYQYQYDGAPTCNEHLLIARRLVEAGVRSVSLSFGRWDSHSKNFDVVRDHGAKLDQCLSALVQDLDERGMLDDVTVVCWGEFGRTPRINDQGGRDHWPQVNACLLAGGGMPTGQVIGATNRLGEYATERPIPMQQVLTQIYHNLGINPMTTTVTDPSGRPQFLVDVREPIAELV